MDKEIKTYQIDFEKNQSMAFTSPLAYRFYRKQEKQVENWRDLYAAVLSDLARSFSHVLKAIHTPSEYANGTIRISLGYENTDEEISYIAASLIKILQR